MYPTKYGPVGNKRAPIKSLKIPTKTEYLYPKIIAVNIKGTKLKPIVRIGVRIDKNLPKIILAASKTDTMTIFLIFFIKKTPSRLN